MKLNERFLRQPCLAAASIILIVLSASVTAAKTNSSRETGQTTSSAGETILTLSDFDAVGDGVTDDGPALQQALDALAEAGGGTLLIPAGQYLIATPVVKDFLIAS